MEKIPLTFQVTYQTHTGSGNPTTYILHIWLSFLTDLNEHTYFLDSSVVVSHTWISLVRTGVGGTAQAGWRIGKTDLQISVCFFKILIKK